MSAYYNENDPRAAAWLRELIREGHIARGDVDERSIEDVTPNDLSGYKQCHFFAGIGGWSYALRLAGVADDKLVWTGSCPCQPFSAAGKGDGFADERHLWPAFFHLIRECRPDVVFGEQVASRAGLAWLDLVQADLEAASYACGAADLCAAGVGSPHIRQRLYWVGLVGHARGERGRWNAGEISGTKERFRRSMRRFADESESAGTTVLAHAAGERLEVFGVQQARPECEAVERSCSPWTACEWIPCRDGKSRPVEPGTFPLAHGAPARVGRLRAYGNAIVAPLAEEFIRAYAEVRGLALT